MKERKLIYSKLFIFNGRYHVKYIQDKKERPIALKIRKLYTVEFTFMPYTWKLGVSVTWRSDYKSILLHFLPFSASIGQEEIIK